MARVVVVGGSVVVRELPPKVYYQVHQLICMSKVNIDSTTQRGAVDSRCDFDVVKLIYGAEIDMKVGNNEAVESTVITHGFISIVYIA